MNKIILPDGSVEKHAFVHNKMLVYQFMSTTTISISHLRRALMVVANKHASLRPPSKCNQDDNTENLMPSVPNNLYNWQITCVTSDTHLYAVLIDEESKQSWFKTSERSMLRCHLLRYSTIDDHEDRIHQNDIIVFNYHPIVFDDCSIALFIDDLQTTMSKQEFHEDHAIHPDCLLKQQSHELLNTQQNLSHAFQVRTHSDDPQESATQTSARFEVTLALDQQLVSSLTQFMSQSDLTLFQLGLSVFYTFLFKLFNSEQHDLCIDIQGTDAQKSQLKNINPFFISNVPCQLKVDPYESFLQFCSRVEQLRVDVLSHCHLPHEEVVKLHPILESPPPRTAFFLEPSINNLPTTLNFGNGVLLERIDYKLLNTDISNSDLTCILYENPQHQLNCISLNASTNIYDKPSITRMIERLKSLLEQIVSNPSIYQLSILLPTDLQLLNDINNTHADYGTIGCIHWNVARQAQQHPHKIALVLENGSLTYAELLYYAHTLATHLITQHTVQPGHVVCQLMERSFEMVIGMLAIMMSGAVYTALSPREPLARLVTCIEQTSAHLILVHQATSHIPLTVCSRVQIDQVLSLDQQHSQHLLSVDDVDVTPEHISHIVFTSGSTGTPKAIQLRHRNFVSYIRSYIIQPNDVTLHHTSVTFDAHVEEILGTLIMSGAVIILRPDGHLDMEMLSKTIGRHQVTYMGTVPSQVKELAAFLKSNNQHDILKTLRRIGSGGEALFTSTVSDIMLHLNNDCRFYNFYGPAECTEAATKHLITKDDYAHQCVPLGRPMANVHVYILDEHLQPVIPGVHVGEIVIGGAGVFAGYRGRDDLTKRVLCKINNEMCYRTGDLGRLNPVTRELEYCGRQDYQVKLRGQRIELGEIESIIMEMAIMCVVVKSTYNNNDHLVAYVETKSSEDDLRQHCISRLPLYMVPSFFVILEKLPLNQNGKIDRKALPLVEFNLVPASSNKGDQPTSELERKVCGIWREALPHVNLIPSTSTSFFSLGGDSLSFMKLFRLYIAAFSRCHLDISSLFRSATIADHVRFLEGNEGADSIMTSEGWITLNIVQGITSFAQTRIYLDERVRFTHGKHVAVYNLVFPFEVDRNSCVSLKRLRRALDCIVNKHAIFRTRVAFDGKDDSILRQTILKSIEVPFKISTLQDKNSCIEDIVRDEETNTSLFNYEQGCVFRCHIIRCTQLIVDDDDLLLSKDILLFNFHHIAFDGASVNIFLRDLTRAYANEDIGTSIFNYIDYSIYERTLDFKHSTQFWHDQFKRCSLHPLQLPYDRIPNDLRARSGRGTHITFAVNRTIVNKILSYTDEHHVTLFQFGITAFYCFLFKLTNDTDLSVATLNENRFRPELADMIGFFVNTILCCVVIDPRQTFLQMLQHVKSVCVTTLSHSHVPSQDIIPANFPIQTIFTVEHIDNNQSFKLDEETIIRSLTTSKTEVSTTIFDLECSIIHSVEEHSLLISLQSSLDLFDHLTTKDMTQRFEHLLHQILLYDLFVCEMSILLSNELQLINDMNDTDVDYGTIGCIHWNVARQAQQHPHKIALVLENGSLTYAELLYYAHTLATHLITQHTVQPGHVVCQLMERSFEMVIGMLAIMMSGAVYTALSPREPLARLVTCIEQTSAHLILVHQATSHIPLTVCSRVQIDQVLSLDQQHSQHLLSVDDVDVTPEHISHIVFTSGSTGTPKAIQLRHRNFVSYIRSYIIQPNDVTLHHTSVTFDAHVEEILGTLIMSGAVIILRPDGHLDMEMLSKTIGRHQVTYMGTVPSQVKELAAFLKSNNQHDILKTLRRIGSGGEALFTSTVSDIMLHLNNDCRFYNFYGPAECTEAATKHLITKDDYAHQCVPLGRPMANVHVYILDEHLQPVIPGVHVGEIVIGGAGVFAGYRGRDDLTKRVLCKINNEMCYRTGDLGRLNPVTRELEYCGRQDYQVKLRGQRIELGEIESIIMEMAIMCVVVKSTYNNNDHLVAYVETKSSEDDLRQHCISRLPLYMVPSFFVILEKLPLNQNGKIDRKALPLVEFNLVPASSNKGDQPTSELERKVCGIWREALPHVNLIPSTSTSFFSLGGNSLSILQLYHKYRTMFPEYTKNFTLVDLFRNISIKDHVSLLLRSKAESSLVMNQWKYLNIVEGPASSAQTTVWLAERVRLVGWPEVSSYNMPSLLQINSGHFSIDQCVKALNVIVAQEWIFRTRLTFDVERRSLRQNINQHLHYPICCSTYKDDAEKETLVNNEVCRPFDTEHDGVFRCHFIQRHDQDRQDELCTGDVIIFHFHHGSFDGRATDVFLEQFKLAYEGKQLQASNLQYMDYSIHERSLAMTEAREYWCKALKGYAWDRQLDLGALSTSISSARRREQGSSLTVTIPSDIAHSMIACANQLNVTLFQLGLTCFYLFLSQISPHNRDACIGINHLNRYQFELLSAIGMFVNILPCRITISSLHTISFVELVEKVQRIFLESAQHSYLPYDQLMDLHRTPTSNLQLPFIQTIFRVDTDVIDYNHPKGIVLNDSCHLSNYVQQNRGGHFDLQLSLIYDRTVETIECEWAYLFDAFETSTVEMHADRFILLLNQLFDSNSHAKLQLPLRNIILFEDENKTNAVRSTTHVQQYNSSASTMTLTKTYPNPELIDRICSVFSRALDCLTADIDVERSFFEQGGTSLRAIQAILLLQHDVSSVIDAQTFFNDPSVIGLAAAISTK